jgi:hypothetical protein
MAMNTAFHRRVVRVAALIVMAACSSPGSTSTTGGTPAIAIGLSPVSGSIAQGAAATVTATATGSGGFSGTATFTVTGLPTGVTYTASNYVTAGSITTASVQLSVGATVTPGTYTLTFTASGTGVSNANMSYALTVTSAAVPGYTLAAAPGTVSIAQGASGSSTITLTRTGGFTGSVALSATGMGSGLTASFNPASTTGNTSALTLTATAGATVGTVTVTIRGTATGLTDQTTTLQVTVTASGGGGGSVSFDFTGCAAINMPVWFAYQDGNGPWTRVTPVGNIYTFTLSSAKVGYAMVSQSGSQTIAAVHMLLRTELTGTTIFCPVTTVKTVNVTVAGLVTGVFANLSLGGGNNYILANGSVAIPNVIPGAQDLVAYRTAVTGGPAITDRAVILRDVNVATGGSAGTVDFGGAGAITPIAGTFNVAGGAAGDAFVANMLYLTGANCTFGAMYTTPSSASPALSMYGIPAASQRATDFHYFQVFARNGATITRTSSVAFNAFAGQTVTLGAMPTTPTVTDLGLAGYKRLQAVGTISTDYSTSTGFIYTQRGTAISAVMTASQGWLGSTSVTMAFPDFTAVTGWNNAWAPAPGVTADWQFLPTYFSYATATGLCYEGANSRTAQVTGSN